MKPGRKSIGRVRAAAGPVDDGDHQDRMEDRSELPHHAKKQENVSGPLTVSVLLRARRHSQDLRSRMNPSSSVMAVSTNTTFPRVPVKISATKKTCRGINALWRRQQLVDSLRNLHDRNVHHSSTE